MSALALPTPLARGMTTAHAQESIRTGQQAWKAIKATAEEQRTLWLEVGVALMYGKMDMNRPVVKTDSRGRNSYQKFSEWVQGMFPGLTDKASSPST